MIITQSSAVSDKGPLPRPESRLILHGEGDNVIALELAKLNKEYFGDQAELIIFENAGHGLHLDQPQKWLEEVRSFLG